MKSKPIKGSMEWYSLMNKKDEKENAKLYAKLYKEMPRQPGEGALSRLTRINVVFQKKKSLHNPWGPGS
jgi:uncharacterized ferritin-like protein (DUF455 family)